MPIAYMPPHTASYAVAPYQATTMVQQSSAGNSSNSTGDLPGSAGMPEAPGAADWGHWNKFTKRSTNVAKKPPQPAAPPRDRNTYHDRLIDKARERARIRTRSSSSGETAGRPVLFVLPFQVLYG